MNVAEIDKNFKVETKLPYTDIVFRSCEEAPFRIYGVFFENGQFRRMPEAIAKSVSVGVERLHANTAGGRVRFSTDSRYVAIQAKMPQVGRMPHFPLSGSSGFDLYIKKDGIDTYYKTFMPPNDLKDGYESVVSFGSSEKREITIHFPLYSNVSSLYIGLQAGASLLPAADYRYEKPIVFYGSSITQGGCASRPGNSYESMLSAWLDANHVNLGFSGSAKGEDAMADYVKNLDMSVLVYDYDYNAPDAEHLERTHERMFLAVREKKPDLPIVILSMPRYDLSKVHISRREIIRNTYENALKKGDKNVYFIDGTTLMRLAGNNGTVDDCHPNDLGFFSMAKALEGLLSDILKAL